MSDTKYGWLCDNYDDEYLSCPHDSVEDALADAKESIEDRWNCGNDGVKPGEHEVEVEVMEVVPVCAFSGEMILDFIEARLEDEGCEEPDEMLQTTGAARKKLVAALDAAWAAHVAAEKVTPYYTQTRRGAKHKITVVVAEPA